MFLGMKIALVLNCSLALLFSCGNAKFNKETQGNDSSLVGSWSGTFLKNERTLNRNWQITRLSDGTFTKDEVLTIRGRNQKFKRVGTWWTKSGTYFEKNNNDVNPVKYSYKLIKNNEVHFTSKNEEDLALEYVEKKQ